MKYLLFLFFSCNILPLIYCKDSYDPGDDEFGDITNEFGNEIEPGVSMKNGKITKDTRDNKDSSSESSEEEEDKNKKKKKGLFSGLKNRLKKAKSKTKDKLKKLFGRKKKKDKKHK
ncbi:hypothetical protein H312_00193, partial [Anncaliia algerae PRA339]